MNDVYILTRRPWTARTLEIHTERPDVIPVFIEAWEGLPEYVRESIAYRLPWGGMIVRFSDLDYMHAAGTCGSDVIRISKDYLSNLHEHRADMINTIQHELAHFYLGHPVNKEPSVKNELEARWALVDWDLASNEDNRYIARIDSLMAMIRRVNQLPPENRLEILDCMREELRPIFTDKADSFEYLMIQAHLNNRIS